MKENTMVRKWFKKGHSNKYLLNISQQNFSSKYFYLSARYACCIFWPLFFNSFVNNFSCWFLFRWFNAIYQFDEWWVTFFFSCSYLVYKYKKFLFFLYFVDLVFRNFLLILLHTFLLQMVLHCFYISAYIYS